MITSKSTTKTWSSAPQESSLKTDKKNNTSATNTGVPEGKEFGEYLNEVADPNYVPPEKQRKAGNPNLDKDAFFKLMLAQVKHQDPTSPMKSDQMAAQLAQFTSLEQLQNMNQKLDELTKAQQPSTQFQALNFIGKSVATDTTRIIRAPGDKTHDMRFTLPREAAKVQVVVKNQTGEEVRKYEINAVKRGEQKVTWNGLDKNGDGLPAGEFYFEIKAEDLDGKAVPAQTSQSGVVTGVNYSSEGPMLMIGNQTIRLSDVSKIEDVNARETLDKKESSFAAPALKGGDAKKEDDIQGAKRVAKGNMDQVAMSYGVLEETNKANQAKGEAAKSGVTKVEVK